MKKTVALLPIVLGFAGVIGASNILHEYWQSAMLSFSVGLVFLGTGILIVNVYLERHVRSGAVFSILGMANDAIASFHNRFLDLAWKVYSTEEFHKLSESYFESNRDIKAVPPDDRRKLFEVFRDNRSEITKLAANLEPVLSETTSLAGWNLDPIVLMGCLDARQSLRKFSQCTFDDSEEDRDRVVEQLLDLDLHTQIVRSELMKISGVGDVD